MSGRHPGPYRVLFLYTELAPYFLACLERLVHEHDVEVQLVRWRVNKEAPFQLRFGERIHVHERGEYDDKELIRLCAGFRPDIAFASGWVDKGYLAVCRHLHRTGIPTVMCSDTAWRVDVERARAWRWHHGTGGARCAGKRRRQTVAGGGDGADVDDGH